MKIEKKGLEYLWFGVQDVQDGEEKHLTIVDVTLEKSKFRDEEDIVLVARDGTFQFKIRLNNTSLAGLLKAWGNETKNWEKKSVVVTKGKVQNKDALIVRPSFMSPKGIGAFL